MFRSIASSGKVGLAVVAMALPVWQLPALAEDGLAQKVETRPAPLEPKTVRIILLPPADDSVFTSWHPESLQKAPVILVSPTEKAALAQPRSEPAKIQEDASLIETPSSPEPSPRVELPPTATKATIASPRPKPVRPRKGATLAVVPALPGRSPFRQAPFKSELADNGPKAAATGQQPGPAPTPAKANSPFRFLAELWPGNKRTGAPVSSAAGSSPSLGRDGNASSLASSTASASAPAEPNPAEAGTKSDNPTNKQKPASFLDVIQFWKK